MAGLLSLEFRRELQETASGITRVETWFNAGDDMRCPKEHLELKKGGCRSTESREAPMVRARGDEQNPQTHRPSQCRGRTRGCCPKKGHFMKDAAGRSTG